MGSADYLCPSFRPVIGGFIIHLDNINSSIFFGIRFLGLLFVSSNANQVQQYLVHKKTHQSVIIYSYINPNLTAEHKKIHFEEIPLFFDFERIMYR